MLQQILRRKEVEKRLGLSRSSIYVMMAEGRFPKSVKLGHRDVGWRSDDLQRWLDEKSESEL